MNCGEKVDSVDMVFNCSPTTTSDENSVVSSGVETGEVSLSSESGEVWLSSESGEVSLSSESGEVWLSSESGEVWLSSESLSSGQFPDTSDTICDEISSNSVIL